MVKRERRVAWWWLVPLGFAACTSAGASDGSSGGCGGGTRGALAAGWFRTTDCPGSGGLGPADDCLTTTPYATHAWARIEFEADDPAATIAAVRSTAPAVLRVDAVTTTPGTATVEIATVGAGTAALVVDGVDGPIDQVGVTVAPATELAIAPPPRMIVGGVHELYGTVASASRPLAGRGGYALTGAGLTITPASVDRAGWFGPGPDYLVSATAPGTFSLEAPGLMLPHPVEVIPTAQVVAVTLSASGGVGDRGHGDYVWLVGAAASDGTGAPDIHDVPCDWRASRPAWLEPGPGGLWVRSPLPSGFEVTCLLDGRVMATVALPAVEPSAM